MFNPVSLERPPLGRLRIRVCLGTLALGLTIAACGGQADVISSTTVSQDSAVAAVADDAGTEIEGLDADASPDAAADERPGLSPLASQVTELSSALPEIALAGVGDPIGEQPRAINLPSLGVIGAPIEPVGLEDNGELEVPDADTVGWYEFGAGVDGGRGSTVLAAHIAYNGQNGVFQNLVDLEPGERFTIERDGEDLEYVVESVIDYDKWELPISDLFNESGEERLILITCGGAFNPDIASYEDNTVVVALPV